MWPFTEGKGGGSGGGKSYIYDSVVVAAGVERFGLECGKKMKRKFNI